MSQITLIAIVLSCALAVVAPQETFKAWKQKYNKVYSAKSVITEAQAQKAFAINAAKVAAHNSDPTATYKLGLNANSDVVQDDSSVKGKYVLNETATPENLKKSQQASPMPTGSKQSSKTMDINLKMSWPTSVDYSADFPPVKSIGTCLSGDMTSSVVDVINYWSKKNGSTRLYSQQNLIDCVTGNQGCNGGSMYANFLFAITNGLADSSTYQYVGKNQPCQAKKYPPVYFLQNSCLFFPAGNETLAERLLVRYGPYAVLYTAAPTFSLYKSGVFYSPTCDNSTTAAGRIAVVVVGFGVDPTGGAYWLIRTALGSSFGLNGYAKVAKGRNNNCGIANVVEVPCVY